MSDEECICQYCEIEVATLHKHGSFACVSCAVARGEWKLLGDDRSRTSGQRSYLFEVGDSCDGALAFNARITAGDRQSAVERLRSLLPQSLVVEHDSLARDEEYIWLYFGRDNVLERDIIGSDSVADAHKWMRPDPPAAP